MQHFSALGLFFFCSSVSLPLHAHRFEQVLAKSEQGIFCILRPSKDKQPASSTLQGPVIALYDSEKQSFCGTLLQDKASGHFALSLIDPLGRATTKVISNAELELFFDASPSIIGCQAPNYRRARKTKLYGLAALTIAGALFTLLGMHTTRARYKELAATPGCNVKAEVLKDLVRCTALILMYLGVDALTGNRGSKLFLAALGTTYSYHSSEHAVMPLLIGPLFCVPSGNLFCKYFWADGYKSPTEVLKYTKIALKLE